MCVYTVRKDENRFSGLGLPGYSETAKGPHTGIFAEDKATDPMTLHDTNRRWYDHYRNIRMLIDLSEGLPVTVQANLGDTLIETIKRYQNLAASSTDLRSMGTEMVMGLYKSRRKLRWYDDSPELHKAYNMMAILPESVLLHLDEQCGDLVHYILSNKHKRLVLNQSMGQVISRQLADVPHVHEYPANDARHWGR